MNRVTQFVRSRLASVYWALVGMLGGLGMPITDRRAMYGSDPMRDPYGMDFDPDRRANR